MLNVSQNLIGFRDFVSPSTNTIARSKPNTLAKDNERKNCTCGWTLIIASFVWLLILLYLLGPCMCEHTCYALFLYWWLLQHFVCCCYPQCISMSKPCFLGFLKVRWTSERFGFTMTLFLQYFVNFVNFVCFNYLISFMH